MCSRSAHSSRASAASILDSNEQGCASPSSASRTPTAGESSPDTGPEPPATRTFEVLPRKHQPLKKLTQDQVVEANMVLEDPDDLGDLGKLRAAIERHAPESP